MLVKVTAYLNSPVILDSDLHLDALLSCVHPCMHNQPTPTRGDTDNSALIQAPLPLFQARYRNEWVWCATAAEFPDCATPVQAAIIKRRDSVDVFFLNRQFQPASGAMKDRFEKRVALLTPSAHWYAFTNDLPALRRLLGRVNHLGALRKCGYGVVSRCEVEAAPGDWLNTLLLHGRRARRRLPAVFCEQPVSCGRLTVRAPYWHMTSAVLGVDVGAAVMLRDGIKVQ